MKKEFFANRDSIENLLQQRLAEAQQGRRYWLDLKERYQVTDDTYVILIPEGDNETLLYVSEILEGFLHKRNAIKALLLVVDSSENLTNKNGRHIFVTCTAKEAENLMRFYCMYQFAPNFIVASLNYPDGRLGKGMLECGKCTKEELFDMVVFGTAKELLVQ